MAASGRDYSWLPTHHHHVAFTLAHADARIGEVAEVLFRYLKSEPFVFQNVRTPSHETVVIKQIRSLPEGVSRGFADATTQLRAAIEHTIYGEIEHQLGRSIEDAGYDARTVEMPAKIEEADFTSWLNHSKRKKIPPLHPGSELVRRIRVLQPFEATNSAQHPMTLLAEHTNHAKHRAPVTSALRVGRVIPDQAVDGFEAPPPVEERARVGDIVARGPHGVLVYFDVWPDIAVQQPHTGEWRVVMRELETIAEWVRETAIPTLIGGTADVDPLPPTIDLAQSYGSVDAALQQGSELTSFSRNLTRIKAQAMRGVICDILSADASSRVTYDDAMDWASALEDEAVLARSSAITSAGHATVTFRLVINTMFTEIETFQQSRQQHIASSS